MAERLIVRTWKVCVVARLPGVRIPLFPKILTKEKCFHLFISFYSEKYACLCGLFFHKIRMKTPYSWSFFYHNSSFLFHRNFLSPYFAVTRTRTETDIISTNPSNLHVYHFVITASFYHTIIPLYLFVGLFPNFVTTVFSLVYLYYSSLLEY